jgi:hypothetical protein
MIRNAYSVNEAAQSAGRRGGVHLASGWALAPPDYA